MEMEITQEYATVRGLVDRGVLTPEQLREISEVARQMQHLVLVGEQPEVLDLVIRALDGPGCPGRCGRVASPGEAGDWFQ